VRTIIGSVEGRIQRRLAWALAALSLVALLAAGVLTVINFPVGSGRFVISELTPLLVGLIYPAVGALVLSRQPRSAVGWLLCALGLSVALTALADGYAIRGLISEPGSLPAAAMVAWLQSWSPGWWFTLGVPLLFLVFPDGRLPSRRWRPMPALLALLLLIQEAILLFTQRELTATMHGVGLRVNNPTGFIAQSFWSGPGGRSLTAALDLLFAVVIGVCGAAMLLRLRRSQGVERQQIKWLAYAATLLVAQLGAYFGFQGAGNTTASQLTLDVVILTAATAIPVAIAVALLRYHLYGIDVVMSKTLLVAAMAVFITAIYVLIVAGMGSLIGSSAGSDLALSLVATAIIALAFQPVRERVQWLANRLVYGHRASPYEILARFGQTVAGGSDGDEILARTAQVLAQGVGAARASVWMRIDSRLVPAAAWPQWPAGPPEPVALRSEQQVDVPGADRSIPVTHGRELLGALAVSMPAARDMASIEWRLLNDLAAQTAVLLRSVSLTAALRARLDDITRQEAELRRSRQRAVAAEDTERRRLERNIHDGAQQHLVALAVKLRLAGSLAARDPARAALLARELPAETHRALATLHELTGGIQPRLLAEAGPAAALRFQAQTMSIHVDVVDSGLARAAPAAEHAAYFCCLEALQNAAKHSTATQVLVSFEAVGRELRFTVTDNGAGFDPPAIRRGSGIENMRDRAESVGGRLEVEASPGAGVTVRGAVPLQAASEVSA